MLRNLLLHFIQLLPSTQTYVFNGYSKTRWVMHRLYRQPSKPNRTAFFLLKSTQIIRKKNWNLGCIHSEVIHSLRYFLFISLIHWPKFKMFWMHFIQSCWFFPHFRFFLVIFPLSFLNTLSKSKITLSNSNLSSNSSASSTLKRNCN